KVRPRVGGSSERSTEAAVVVADLHEGHDLVPAPGAGRAAQWEVDEGGAAHPVIRVLAGAHERGQGGREQGRVLVAQDLVIEVAHYPEHPLGAEVVPAIDVADFRIPEVAEEVSDEPRRVVPRG